MMSHQNLLALLSLNRKYPKKFISSSYQFRSLGEWVFKPFSNEYTGKEILPRFFGTVSGKINDENIKSVLKTGTKSIDISSGFENEIGEISIDKINSFFKYLKKNDLFYILWCNLKYKDWHRK